MICLLRESAQSGSTSCPLARDSDPATATVAHPVWNPFHCRGLARRAENAQKNGIEEPAFYCGDAESRPAGGGRQARRPFCCDILDPPRKRLRRATDRNGALRPQKHVTLCVVCNPATLRQGS